MALLDKQLDSMADMIRSAHVATRLGTQDFIPAAVMALAASARQLLRRAEGSYRERRLACERLTRYLGQLDEKLIKALQDGMPLDDHAPFRIQVLTKPPAVRWSETSVRMLLEHLGADTTYEEIVKFAVAGGWVGQPKPYLEWVEKERQNA